MTLPYPALPIKGPGAPAPALWTILRNPHRRHGELDARVIWVSERIGVQAGPKPEYDFSRYPVPEVTFHLFNFYPSDHLPFMYARASRLIFTIHTIGRYLFIPTLCHCMANLTYTSLP